MRPVTTWSASTVIYSWNTGASVSEQAVRPVILINPPPLDRRCEGCGKSADELPAFGPGSFEGATLVKDYRGSECVSAYWSYLNCLERPPRAADPGGKSFGSCHLDAHTEEGREKCVRQLLEFEGCERVMAWLEGLREVAVSGVVEDAGRLVVSWAVVN
jgi:hypothetical protein